ncbi:MAG: hypothetical protein MRY59_04035 [Aquisalinus sp.]|nr:hypothetical protein [Aquisalinus sp.]
MQETLFTDNRTETLCEVDRRLTSVIRTRGKRDRLPPAHQLVLSMLGNRTYDFQSRTAYEKLLASFRTLEAVSCATPEQIMPLIEGVNFADVKAERIPSALSYIIAAHGNLRMDFLKDMPTRSALSWLGNIRGVGRKVAAAVLNFSTLERPALALDSHHLRVMSRLGIISPRYNAEKAYDLIMPLLPTEWTARVVEEHHVKIKILGQQVCHFSHAICHQCPLRDICPSAFNVSPDNKNSVHATQKDRMQITSALPHGKNNPESRSVYTGSGQP